MRTRPVSRAIRVSEESADKFELVNEGYQLVKDGSYLVVQEISSHSHDGITFDTEWDSSDDVVSTISENMNIVLMDDVTYNSSNITIGRGIVNLCLNGHKFDMGLNGITVESGAELMFTIAAIQVPARSPVTRIRRYTIEVARSVSIAAL